MILCISCERCRINELEQKVKKICRVHQHSHKRVRTRCHIQCISEAVNEELYLEKIGTDCLYQCDICDFIFDGYTSAYFHVC